MSATPNINLLKIQGNKFDATAAPTVNDDTSTGFSVGSKWIDVTNDKAYNCVDATTGAAVWNEAGGGGDSIYTADGTLTGDRTIDLDGNKLTFNIGAAGTDDRFVIDGSNVTANNTDIFTIQGISNKLTVNENGYIKNENVQNNEALYLSNSTGSYGIASRSVSNLFVNTNQYFFDTFGSTNYIQVYSQDPANGIRWVKQGNVQQHWIRSGNLDRAWFFMDGLSGTSGFIVGANAKIGTEDISLQGNTLVKGSDSAAATTGFKVTDINDASLWDFRNDGSLIADKSKTSLKAQNTTANSYTEYTFQALASNGTRNFFIGNAGEIEIGKGINNTTTGDKSVDCLWGAEGLTRAGSGQYAVVIGSGNNATFTGTGVVAIGKSITTSIGRTVGIGETINLGHENTYGIGRTLTSGASESLMFGTNINGNGRYGAAIGHWLETSASGASVIGIGNTTTGAKLVNSTANSLALGWNSTTPQHLFKTDGVDLTGDVITTGNVTGVSTSSIAAFIAKGDGSSQDGYIQLNCWNNNHGIKLKSPPHSAAASYTLTFPNDTGSNGQFLKTDGSGVLSWGAAGSSSPLTTKGDVYTYDTADARLPVGTNGQVLVADSTEATGLKYVNLSETPAVGGGLLVDLGFGAADQVITVANNATTINFDDTVTGAVDKNGDWNNTSKKFIVSSTSGAGTYQFEVNLFCQNTTSAYYNLQAFIGGVLKTPNGAFAMSDAVDDSGFDGVAGAISLDLDVGDEVEIKLQSYNATTTISANGTWNFTQGMRVSKTSGIKGEKGDTGTGAPVSLSKTFTLQEPTASDDITAFRTNVDITVQEVIACSTGTSPSTTYQLKHHPTRSDAGNALTTSAATTSTTTGDTASLSDATIPANSWIWIETSAASGTDVYLSVDIRYTED
jgi:hypothetical protein